MSIETTNPARPRDTVARYDEHAPEDVPSCVARAAEAQAGWAALPQPERAARVSRWLDRVSADTDAIAAIVTAEMGKTRAEARGEIGKSVSEGRFVLARAGAPMGEVLPSQVAGTLVETMRRPRGVFVGIAPWNFPVGTPLRKLVPAFLYGNAMLLKPSEIAPGAALRLLAAAEGVLPDGLFQVLIGGGALGAAMAGAEGLGGVSFTGSVATGRRVAEAAARTLTDVNLELGGKNPAILNDASNLDAALDQIHASAFAIAGQRCTAVSRVIVHDDLADRVIDGLRRRADATRLGDGAAEGVTMGPLSSRDQYEKVLGFLDRARAAGATIHANAPLPEDNQGGYFVAPAIVSDVAPDAEIAMEEVFGPVLTVLPYGTVDDALRIANSVRYGLTSALYSEDARVIGRFVASSASGMLHVNNGTFPQDHAPFVGLKNSGLGVGGSNGASTIQFYTSEHAVYRRSEV